MRVTFNLSDAVVKQLNQAASDFADGNASLVADLALKRLLFVPGPDLERLIARHKLDRRANTRSGWTEAFWRVLGEEMGRVDMINNPYAARNYGEFYAVLLLKDVGHYDEDDDPFVFHVAPQMSTAENAQKQMRFSYDRTFSPVAAAEEVAQWLKTMQTEGTERT